MSKEPFYWVSKRTPAIKIPNKKIEPLYEYRVFFRPPTIIPDGHFVSVYRDVFVFRIAHEFPENVGNEYADTLVAYLNAGYRQVEGGWGLPHQLGKLLVQFAKIKQKPIEPGDVYR